MPGSSEHLEKLISSLGGRGRFQNSVHILTALPVYSSIAFNNVGMAFHGSFIPHTCMAGDRLPNNSSNFTLSPPSVQLQVTNVSHTQCSSTLTYTDGQEKVIECTSGQWNYFPEYGERNIVSDFDLVCSGEYLSNLATTIYFTGVMLGGLVFGDLADRFGRRPIALFTLYTSVIAGLVSAFSVNYFMFVCLRFIVGILIQGVQMATYTLIVEMFPPKDRPYAGIATDMVFPIAIILLTGLAYALPYWRHLQLAISLLPLLSIFYVWYIPESLRWLVIKEKTQKAEKLLNRICKTNKIPYPKSTWNLLEKDTSSQEKTTEQHHVTDLFRTWPLTKVTIVSSYLWIVVAVTYFGLTFKTTALPGNKYTNFFIGGVMEFLTCCITLYMTNRFGRKKPMFGCLAGSAVFCLASGLVHSFTSDLGYVVTSLALTGKCFAGGLFVMYFVYATEVYPTVVRNIGLGFGLIWARLGSMLAPQFNQWSSVILGFDAIYVFGTLNLVGSLAVLLLPETHKRRLPDTIEQEVGGLETPEISVEQGEDIVKEDLL
ncbi:solute carrier family 22 member 6-A [Elysia marginata]|uniref:Solute carrier family 22 member 6-A n=1 Tax=Elysia marginata TaxID=1093978 RepID=A0AAV4ECP2_9GAST|nr:solute carrier family 22 member 6-A [Elysia marginata]